MTRLRFLLERLIQKGVLHQLLLMAALIVCVALLGGLTAWAAKANFATLPEAVWWAFLRLTDPGYLGDDAGVVLRVISTVVTVLGYVLFMGSMIAIMTQWLARTLRKLESGLTPIRMNGHVLVLGWTNRTPEIVLKLLDGRGRLERFLAGHNVSRLRVVVMSDEVGAERRLELRDYLGEHWNESQVFLRSGSSLRPDDLRRLDIAHASTVIIPGADFELGGAEASDTRVVKSILTVSSLLGDEDLRAAPQIVGEIFDPLKIDLARNAISSPVQVIASNRIIGRLLSQCIRHPGLAQVLFGILSHRRGNSIYLREYPELVGRSPRDLHDWFPRAIVLGSASVEAGIEQANLSPSNGAPLREGELLVLMAPTYDDCVPEDPGARADEASAPRQLHGPLRQAARAGQHRVLVLGWSHRIGSLVEELNASGSGHFELTVMSRVSAEEREHWLRRIQYSNERITVRHVLGDYALQTDLVGHEPEAFDTILFLASDWMPSSQQADARTILGYVLLRSLLRGVEEAPKVLVELLDPDNAHLFADGSGVHLITPRALSYLLAHVALRPELNAVFDSLFGAGGAEFSLCTGEALGLEGEVSFREIQRAALASNAIALGVLTREGPEMNPERGRGFVLGVGVQVVVLADV